MKKTGLLVALTVTLLLVPCAAQQSGRTPTQGARLLDEALGHFRKGDYRNALVILRRIPTSGESSAIAADASYWTILSEMALGDYEAAGSEVDRFVASYRHSARYPDVLYQQGRLDFIAGAYEKALIPFQAFISGYPRHEMYPAALYWAGECMYRLGQYRDAEKAFSVVVEKYPASVKRESAQYRLDLIEQKYREVELLKLLKWSHEESLKTIEEFERREKTYEQAVNALQRKVADMLKDSRQADLEVRIAELEKQNADLTRQLNVKDADGTDGTDGTAATPAEELKKLRAEATELRDSYAEWLSKNDGAPHQ